MNKHANEHSTLSPRRETVPAGPKGIAPRPGQTVCGDLDMRIDRNGVWYHDGSPIGRKELVRLFSRVLRRDDAGDYWLVTPAEIGRIEVEDAPFLAVEIDVSGQGAHQSITIRTNVDDFVTVDRDHAIRVDIDPVTGEPRPYVVVAGGVEAKITRAVYYDLVALGVEDKTQGAGAFGVWSEGQFFHLGRLENLEADAP